MESPAHTPRQAQRTAMHALVLALAVAVGSANSLGVPFLLDDPRPGYLLEHTTRPLVWESFALNRALGGAQTWGYHVFNALVHLACGLLLLGLLKRVIARVVPGTGARTRTDLALVTVLLWISHPLQTEAVTYLSQRAETLGALFYLGLLYAFVRSTSSSRPWAWQALALVSLGLGFATKETIATAPVAVFLLDATLIASGPRAALRERRGFHAVLALVALGFTLVFIFPLLGAENSTAGFRLAGSGPLEYLRTQPGVLLHYLRLAFWPHPLCFDYGWPIAEEVGDYLPQSLAVGGLLVGSLVLLVRRSWIGLVGTFFFLYLAPTSSIVPIKDPAFEHRMYLPLAAVVLLTVVGLHTLLARVAFATRRNAIVLSGVSVVALLAATLRRNQDYRSDLQLWQVTVLQAPHNGRAHANLAAKWLDVGKPEQAVPELVTALELGEQNGFVFLNLGNALLTLGEVEQAIPYLERAAETQDDFRCPEALGRALLLRGDPEGAEIQFRRSLELRPNEVLLHLRRATALSAGGRAEEALTSCREALRLEPEFPEARELEIKLLTDLGRLGEAIENSRRECVRNPLASAPQDRLGRLRFLADDFGGAAEAFGEALRLAPEDAGVHYRLGCALLRLRRPQDALEHLREAVRLKPELESAHIDLSALLCELGQPEEALEHARKALEIAPNTGAEHYNLGQALRALGRFDDALAAFREASRLAPELPEPLAGLARTVGEKPDADRDEREEALRLASRANELTHSARPDLLEILAVSLAALGDYAGAAARIEEALALPGPRRNEVFASRLRARLEEYRARTRE